MTSTKRLVLAALLVAGPLGAASQAQPFNQEQMAERMSARMDTLMKQLDLTAEQEEPVRAVLAELVQQRLQLRQRGARRGPVRERMQALNDSTAARLEKLLTEAQMDRYRELSANNRGGRRRF